MNRSHLRNQIMPLFADRFDSSEDANKWISSSESQSDWEEKLQRRQDILQQGWTSYSESLEDTDEADPSSVPSTSLFPSSIGNDMDDSDTWLNAINEIAADEITFMNTEADRADKVRQMQEWGFSRESIASTLGVATDTSMEIDPSNQLLSMFQEETKKTGFGMVVKDVTDTDPQTVESHTTIERDDESGEPIRSQMVYVDEHTCIGCTNCAMVARSTFFMEPTLGRARVFQQWGDDDETIQIAIETCPVDCIHYVPYDELVRLEIDRRNQNINPKARLVSQGEYGGGQSHRVGGPSIFTEPQKISGNMKPRCNNCPSRGCANCPMYGIGKNPAFVEKEKVRKEKLMKRRLKEQLEGKNLSADL